MYRWASPHEDERQAAVRYWRKAIEIAVEMGVDTMNSEFGRGPSPDRSHKANCCGELYTHESSEAAWWRSMEELVPGFEKEGIQLNIETSVNIAYGYDIRGEIIGETGVVTLAESNNDVVKTNGGFSGHVPVDWKERFGAAFDTEFREWIAAASNGGAAGPSAWDGYVATVVTTTGVKAIATGARELITLREGPTLYA